jgi:mRNA interferase MazF
MLQPKIGDIYMMEFKGTEHIQQGIRPAVITQNNVGNIYSPNVIAVPLTSRMTKSKMPTHVFIPCAEVKGLTKNSIALCESQDVCSKSDIGEYLGRMPEKYMSLIGKACVVSTPTLAFINTKEEVLALWEQIRKQNNINIPLPITA